jgi:sn-glycerol 3-phosphate transport system permease protein
MVEQNKILDYFSHFILCLGVAVVAFPIYLVLVASTHSAQEMSQSPVPLWFGSKMFENYYSILTGNDSGFNSRLLVSRMLWVSLVMALGVATGKIVISIMSAFAVVYFRFPFRKLVFWGIFLTLMLPVEVRIVPTYKVIADLGLVNTYTGLIVPLTASATATFLFRQFFLTLPDEITEAAKMDGASPWRFFWHILLPLSRTSIAALFVIQFIYGWNQYLWPLLISTDEQMYPIVMGIHNLSTGGDTQITWNLVMACTILAMLPPALVVVGMQKWFVKGLVDSEK